jgi:hypothetical protein
LLTEVRTRLAYTTADNELRNRNQLRLQCREVTFLLQIFALKILYYLCLASLITVIYIEGHNLAHFKRRQPEILSKWSSFDFRKKIIFIKGGDDYDDEAHNR